MFSLHEIKGKLKLLIWYEKQNKTPLTQEKRKEKLQLSDNQDYVVTLHFNKNCSRQGQRGLTQWKISTHPLLFCSGGSNPAHELSPLAPLSAALTVGLRCTSDTSCGRHSNMPWDREVLGWVCPRWRWSLVWFQWRSCSCPQWWAEQEKTVDAAAGNH